MFELAGFLPDLDSSFMATARWPLVGVGFALIILLNWSRRSSQTTLKQLAGELLLVVPAYFAYFAVRGLVHTREAAAFHRAIDVIELEQALGIFWEPDLQQQMMQVDWLVNVANWTYVWGHWPVIVLAATWLFLVHREEYGTYRNAFLISGGIGLIIFSMLPVAPPRFMDAWGFVDTVTERSHSYRVLQPPAFVNQYAAMPSLHFGWNLLVGIALVRHSQSRVFKAIGVALPIVMFASIVLTANHYIIDGLAGGTLALIGLGGAMALHTFLQNQDHADAHPPLAPNAT
jgi:hypothetical protein